MTYYNFAGYMLFAFITSVTPGPNNIILFSHGKSFGFKNSGKLMFGIVFGFLLMLYAAGYGIAEIITRNQIAGYALKISGSIWLLYLAFAMRKIDSNIETETPIKIGFWNIFLLQFLNTKAWIMAISGAGAFMPNLGNIHLNVFIFSFSFCFVGFPCMIIWLLMGDVISKWLTSPRSNIILGNILFLLLLTSILMIWI